MGWANATSCEDVIKFSSERVYCGYNFLFDVGDNSNLNKLNDNFI